MTSLLIFTDSENIEDSRFAVDAGKCSVGRRKLWLSKRQARVYEEPRSMDIIWWYIINKLKHGHKKPL